MRNNLKVENLIAPIIKAMGYELWGLELHQSGKRTMLRVYIDLPANNEGKNINVEDCSQVSRQIGSLFDVENPILGSYTLEVSSPGINRPLFKLDHYQHYIGSLISVRLVHPKNGKRNFIGTIKTVLADSIELLADNEVFTFELANINKANLM
jgi:ribosome maturation factor RimP